MLYPDHNDQRASQNVRQVIHRLRKLLKDDVRVTPVLLIDSATIRVNPEAGLVSDVAQFSENLKLTRQFIRHHSHRRLEVCRTCNEKIESLLPMYGGSLLDGYLPNTGGHWMNVCPPCGRNSRATCYGVRGRSPRITLLAAGLTSVLRSSPKSCGTSLWMKKHYECK
jgi:hypothetical protein